MFRTTICVTLVSVALVTAQERQDPPRFRVGVDAVRIDAVVVDRDGRVVSDLTADDFEIRQDGKLQKVTFAELVPVLTGTAPPAANASTPASPAVLVAAPAQVRREHVQRTFAVVDDLGLSVESFMSARKAPHAFVDRELRTYAAGSELTYAYEIYNATGAVQSSTTVWRGIQKVLDAAPATLKPPAGGERRFAATGGIKLGEQLPAGNYMLQIAATMANPKREGRALAAVQRITFDVR